jgi:hypothetical protein
MEATLNQLRRWSRVPEPLLATAQFRYESLIGVIRAVKDPAALMSDAVKKSTWYIGPKSGDVFWPGVKRRLSESLPATAIRTIDDASSKVLSVMSAPGALEIDTRGLVLGYVQSGKTTSFISVIAKAADAGYRVFIILSGVTDNLRNQTQTRVDNVLVGPAGKGWYKLTEKDADFAESAKNAANLLRGQDFRFIAVVKKNPARLRKLRDWLRAAGPAVLAGAPIILIDDEADQASIDVSKQNGRTSTINGLLREILDQPKAAYVAYTATPFANLLIDPMASASNMAKDLYPVDFIVPLPEPDGYFGAQRMFGRSEQLHPEDPIEDGLDVIRNISVDEAPLIRPGKGKGAVYSWNPSVTPALRESIMWFLLSTAGRRIRSGDSKHATMLVHTSMLAEAHQRLAQVLIHEIDRIASALSSGDAKEIGRFADLYAAETSRVRAEDFDNKFVRFELVAAALLETALETRVIVDNYQSIDRLDYDDNNPATTIVVGGNTLSRGLTLEGLSSSYFVRSASAYDTLLQMGRWFGYRRGYEDLCRVWMTDELREWFRDLSLVEAEIRYEMLRYEVEGLTPRESAVRIRTHPQMAITAAAKMRNATTSQMSYSGMRPQTIMFARKDGDVLRKNAAAVKKLLVGARESGRVERTFASGKRGFSGVDASDVLALISAYEFHPESLSVKRAYLDKYIRNENAANALLKWSVVVMEGDTAGHAGVDLGLNSVVSPLRRSRLANTSDDVANFKAIVSTMDRVADVDIQPSEVARQSRGPRGIITDAELLTLRSKEMPNQGLLCVYPIDRNSIPQGANESGTRASLDAAEDVIGLAFFFPRAVGAHSDIEYRAADLSGLLIEDVEDEVAQMEAADAADDASLQEVG